MSDPTARSVLSQLSNDLAAAVDAAAASVVIVDARRRFPASGVVWNHAWSSYLNTEVNVRFQKDEYQNFNRSDDIRSLGLRAGYRFRRWLTLGAEYTYTQRDSNISIFEYDRNLYLLTATLSM